MINFKQYLVEEENKATDELSKSTVVRKAAKEMTLEDVIKDANPTIWTAREIGNNKYLIYNKKYINITELKKQIDILYNNKGYKDYGFSKLSESELIRYTMVKNILMTFFRSVSDDEIDPESVANKLFISELKEFDWKPEEY
jgi:hypothetical protein